MKPGDKLNLRELIVLLNRYRHDETSPQYADFKRESKYIEALDDMGTQSGYVTIAQLAQLLCEVQGSGDMRESVAVKRERFEALGWKLPDDFEKVARK